MEAIDKKSRCSDAMLEILNRTPNVIMLAEIILRMVDIPR